MRLAGNGPADAPQANDTQFLTSQPGQGYRGARTAPFPPFRHRVVKTDLPVPSQEQGHYVVGNLVDAVVRDVGDGNPFAGGGVDGDVIHANAVPADNDALFGRPYHVGCYLSETGHDGVGFLGQAHQRFFRWVGGLNNLGADFRQDFPLRRGGRPDVISDQDAVFGAGSGQRNILLTGQGTGRTRPFPGRWPVLQDRLEFAAVGCIWPAVRSGSATQS